MKSIALLILLAVGITGANAQSTMLKVRMTDNSRLNVSVDGRYFNKTGTSVTVGDLPPGRHTIQVYTMQQDRRGRGRQEVIYSGKIFTHPGNITLFTYDPASDQTNVDEQDINAYTQNNPLPPQGQGERQPYQNNRFQGQVNNNNNDNGNDNRYIQPTTPVASPVTSGTLTDAKVDQLKTSTADKKTDTEKMNLLKDGLNSETMTTTQISTIMDWFSFEDTKVSFAKWAYPNTVDKENFTSLENKFSYKNYQDDLDKFIRGQ